MRGWHPRPDGPGTTYFRRKKSISCSGHAASTSHDVRGTEAGTANPIRYFIHFHFHLLVKLGCEDIYNVSSSMASDLQALAQVLEASLDPTKNKQGEFVQKSYVIVQKLMNVAERIISSEEKKPGFSVSLLQIVAAENYGSVARLASALYFKNFIKRSWTARLFILLKSVLLR